MVTEQEFRRREVARDGADAARRPSRRRARRKGTRRQCPFPFPDGALWDWTYWDGALWDGALWDWAY